MKRIRFLLLTLVALLAGINASATKTVYVDPVGTGTWMTDNPAISLYVFGSGDGWATSETLSDGVIKFTFDDKYTKMIIVRGPQANANSFIDRWNQSGDITDIQLNKLYKANGYDNGALAYTVENYAEPVAVGYTCDFNTAIAVPSNNHSDPMFQVSTGWTRIADRKDGDKYYGTAGYYMRYTYSSNAGVGGTGTLLANAQQAPQSTSDGTIETVNDYIVTPKVSGTITLQVKGSTSASNSLPSFINFYAVDDDATTVGSEIVATYSADLNTTDFVTATLTINEATRIAIRGQWVYMDNFTATSAEIPEVKAITVTSVMNTDGQSGYTGTNPTFEQQSDGSLLVKLKVTIQNTGNVDIVASTAENYTLTLASATSESAAKTYYEDTPIAITEDLSVGESTTVNVEVAVNYTDTYGAFRYWFARENLTGTTSSNYRYATSVAYEPKFVFRAAESSSTSSLSSAQAFGMISEETTKNFEIANTGTAPLTIKSITLPTGFTSANMPEIPNEGLVIAKNASQALNITLPVDANGAFNGNLVIVYLDKNDVEQTYELAFSGNVLAAGTWFADFNVASSSEMNYPAASIAEGGIRFGTTYISSGNYDGYLYSYTYSSYATENNKFITPKLHANAGDKLTFDVRRDDSGSATYKLRVYVSTDRKTWGDPIYSVTAADLTSSFQTKEISFDAQGDYYVAFAIYGVQVDNIVGLEKVDVAHDLYIKSVTWPDASVNSGAALASRPKVVVIPLTDETADSYTVKYVCGSTVLAECTPVALTASATSTKEFDFNWTPSVESTTTFENSKVVFDFGGGVKYETEPFNLTVLKEPKFHFVKDLPTSKWYEPSDYTTPLAFGKTNSADQKMFYVNNWGSAPLTVKSIVVPVGFTVTPVGEFIVAAFDGTNAGIPAASQAIEITFSATEAGTYSGNMVITYVDGNGNDQTFELPMSGTKLDPTKFYANFDDGGWPAGSVYQNNVSSTSDGNSYYISCSGTTNNFFVTPKLTAAAGDKIAFDAKLYNNSTWLAGAVKVYMATTRDEVLNTEDGTTRVLLATFSGESAEDATKITTDYKTFEVTIPAAGDYYLGFEISNRPYVDEIYGLTTAAVAHDWKIASSNIPTEPMQNVTQTATVNILNFGLADEAADSYTVTAYVDGKAAGTGSAVAIPMNHQLSDAGTQISVNFLSPKAGTFPVYLEVKAGDYSVTTEPVDVTFAYEVAKSDVATGESAGTDGSIPLNLYYKNSETIALYTQSALGLSGGEKIKSITWKGYTTSAHASTLKVYYQWIDATSISTPSSSSNYDVTGMIAAIEPTSHSWTVGGSASELQDQIVVNFDSPITYEAGKSLLILVSSSASGFSSSSSAIQFEKSTTTGFAYQHQNDGTQGVFTGNWGPRNLPMIHIGLEATATTLSGAVKTSAREAIEGATVTLKAANGVEYSGTTNASGEYSINVIQAGLDFTATIEKDGYLKKQFDYSLGGVSKTLDVTLYQQMGIVGTFPGFDWVNDKVMTQDPENPNIFTLEIPDVALEATEYKYKLRADGIWKASSNDGYELPSSGNNSWTVYTAGTYNLKFTADVSAHTLDFELPFTLAEDATGIVDLNWVTITIERDFKAGWNAAILPFNLTAGEITTAFGATAEVAKFLGDEDNGAGSVTVKYTNKTDGISAGVPFLIHLDAPVSNLVFTKDVSATIHPVAGTSFDFTGVYTMTDVNAGDYFIKDGEFKKATTNNKVRPFRAYLKAKVAGVRDINFEIVDGDEVTRIEDVNVVRDFFGEDVYNMNGQKVDNLRKGLYIINGKKVVIK